MTRRQFVLIALAALAGLLLAFVWTSVQPKVYTATAGYVTAGGGSRIGESYSSQTLAQQKAKAYVTLVTNRHVTEAVVKDLGLDATPQALAARITATVPEEGVSISVTASGLSPRAAKSTADSVVTRRRGGG